MEQQLSQHGMKPTSADILNVIRRDIEQLLLPELTSAYARTVAAQIDTALRHLIVREQRLEPLLREMNGKYAALLGQLSRDSAEDKTGNGGNVIDQLWDQATAAVGGLEATLTTRVREEAPAQPMAPIADPVCLQAIDAERTFIQQVLDHENTLAHPVYSAAEAAVITLTPKRMMAYLSKHLPGRAGLSVTHIEKIMGGFSKETYFVDFKSDAGAESVVIRRDNPYGGPDSSVLDEVPVLSALHRKGIAVARPLLVESDPTVFGYPFMVMEKLPGASQSATAGIVVDATHVAAAKGLAEVLASIHRLDPVELGLPRAVYDPALTTADYQHRFLDQCEAGWRKNRLRPSPTLTCAFEWLRRNVPESTLPPRLVHGDAGLHNLLLHEGKVSAMLDWELAHFGDPTEDLTYCRLWIDSVMPWQEFLAHYYQHGGPEYAEHNAVFYANRTKLLHVTQGARLLRGFTQASQPELNQLYPELHYMRMFQNLLAGSISGQ